jgi:hypothetical protein
MPVKADKIAVCRQYGAKLRAFYMALDFIKHFSIVRIYTDLSKWLIRKKLKYPVISRSGPSYNQRTA